MKTLQDVITEQRTEVDRYRKIADQAVQRFCLPNETIIGVFLSGSTARGDARNGPFGFMIDLIVVVKDRHAFDLNKIFGPNKEPSIPHHCISYEGVGLQIELSTIDELSSIRSRSESEIFAKHEAAVLLDKTGFLSVCLRLSMTVFCRESAPKLDTEAFKRLVPG